MVKKFMSRATKKFRYCEVKSKAKALRHLKASRHNLTQFMQLFIALWIYAT